MNNKSKPAPANETGAEKTTTSEQHYDPETFADRKDISDKLKAKLKRLQEEDPNIYPVF